MHVPKLRSVTHATCQVPSLGFCNKGRSSQIDTSKPFLWIIISCRSSSGTASAPRLAEVKLEFEQKADEGEQKGPARKRARKMDPGFEKILSKEDSQGAAVINSAQPQGEPAYVLVQ